MSNNIKDLIITEFSKVWELNDEAHRLKHFNAVEACGLEINRRLNLGYDPKLITLVAFFHDMYAWDRGNHHQMSARWVETTDHPIIAQLEPRERAWVYWGCLQHRASFEGVFANTFSEMMNAADRELPGNVAGMIERGVQYRTARGVGADEARAGAIEHIKGKFGRGGYARYPDLYEKAFGNVLEAQYEEIAAL